MKEMEEITLKSVEAIPICNFVFLLVRFFMAIPVAFSTRDCVSSDWSHKVLLKSVATKKTLQGVCKLFACFWIRGLGLGRIPMGLIFLRQL